MACHPIANRCPARCESNGCRAEFSVADWIDQSLLDVPNNPLEEYSWTLISAVYYRPEQEQWTAIDGTTIDLETLVEFEAEQNINTSACGGSHRLMALAKAVEFARKKNIIDRPGYQLALETLEHNLNLMRRYQIAMEAYRRITSKDQVLRQTWR